MSNDVSYLGQEEAQALDADLMGPIGFSVDQLMELAGLAVATATATEYPADGHPRVLVLVGPGNNGGDGLVAARHLWQFGHKVEVCYPKRTDKPLFHGLVTQLEAHNIPFVQPEDLHVGQLAQRADVVLDALFGFSFKGPPRAPLDKLLQAVRPAAKPPPVVSVDIPSGWDVEKGPVDAEALQPNMLVSLTVPKQGAKHFKGTHYVGGRFVPPKIKEKYKLKLPKYPGEAQVVRIS